MRVDAGIPASGHAARRVVVSEPSPLNALLGLDPDRVDGATLVRLVRLLVRALGDAGTATNGTWCSSAPAGTSAAAKSWPPPFPNAVGLGPARPGRRRGVLLANPPGWLGHRMVPAQTSRRFGLDPGAVRGDVASRVHRPRTRRDAVVGRDRSWSAALYRLRRSSRRGVAAGGCAFRDRIDAAAIERMTEQSRFYSKDSEPQAFPAIAGTPPDERRDAEAAERFAEPGYRALASHSTGEPPHRVSKPTLVWYYC